MEKNVIIYTYRYMWRLKDSDSVCVKIVSDVLQGLSEFENQLLALDGLESACKEYVHEYSCELLGKVDVLLKKNEDSENETV